MPQPVRVFQRQVNSPVLFKLAATAAVLALCLLGGTYSISGEKTLTARHADVQISKLDVKTLDSNIGIDSAPRAKLDELTTANIFHAVDATQASGNAEQDDTWETSQHLNTKEVSRQAELTKEEVVRQTELEAERQLIFRQADPVHSLVYFNDAKIMARLGCPPLNFTHITSNHTCFYQNLRSSSQRLLPRGWDIDHDTGCAAVFWPLPADFGRPWCLQKSELIDKKVEAALRDTTNAEVLHLNGTTLLLGMLSGPNPTHQLNIHFYAMYVWMKKNNMQMGDLQIVADCPYPTKCMGTYGIGLARAFGSLRFLPELPSVTTFDEVKFSMSVGFPFDIHKYELDKTLDCDFLELTWAVKQHYGIDPEQKANPKRVVIAARRPDESRALGNSAELLAHLLSQGYNASIVTFGDLTFKQQLEAVSDAAVLVGVTGSDLINLVFLPISGSIVEIFPVAQGQQVFTPELWNLAHMVAKNHLKYVSPYNSTLMTDSEGNVIGDRPVHQTMATDVHVPGLVALIEAAALAAVLENTVWNRISIEPHASGKGIKCWDRSRD